MTYSWLWPTSSRLSESSRRTHSSSVENLMEESTYQSPLGSSSRWFNRISLISIWSAWLSEMEWSRTSKTFELCPTSCIIMGSMERSKIENFIKIKLSRKRTIRLELLPISISKKNKIRSENYCLNSMDRLSASGISFDSAVNEPITRRLTTVPTTITSGLMMEPTFCLRISAIKPRKAVQTSSCNYLI